jgi:glycosyltransferase involved in cell wall biosynthesis
MLALSVVICTHNPRPHYLSRVLDSLRQQTLPKPEWELLLIDNMSKEPVAETWDLGWHPNARHVLEPELGLAPARRRGIGEAAGELLIFVDDDNLLDHDYLRQALEIGRSWPKLGTWGSAQIQPEFEIPPSAPILPYISYLALRDGRRPAWSNVISCRETIPVGAGLCVRAKVAAAYLDYCTQSEIQITDRKGDSLLGHGDYEICFVGCKMGLGMGIFPELRMIHLIPRERLSESYFVRLLEGTRASGMVLAYKWQRAHPPSPFSARNALSIVTSFLVSRGFERQVFFARLRGNGLARRLLADQHE